MTLALAQIQQPIGSLDRDRKSIVSRSLRPNKFLIGHKHRSLIFRLRVEIRRISVFKRKNAEPNEPKIGSLYDCISQSLQGHMSKLWMLFFMISLSKILFIIRWDKLTGVSFRDYFEQNFFPYYLYVLPTFAYFERHPFIWVT